MPPDTWKFGGQVIEVAAAIARQEPGPLAELRRPAGGHGSTTFWRLYHAKRLTHSAERWEAAMQAMALLTPTGRDRDKASAHDGDRTFGAALFHALNPGLSPREVRERDPSRDQRLITMLTAPPEARRVMLLRLVRMLARDGARFDLRPLVALILFDDADNAQRRNLARDYYAAEAAAARSDKDTDDA